MKRAWIILLLLMVPFSALAGGNALGVRKHVEMSMLLSGNIDVEKDGSVSSYKLDQPGKIPSGVLQLIESTIPKWRFDPVLVDGQPVRARAKMGLRIVAQKAGEDKYNLRIAGSSFGESEKNDGKSITARKFDAPRYPESAAYAGITGTVFLVMKVGRDGKVEDLIAEQVNLNVVGTEDQMRQGRDLLSRAARAAGRKWTFNAPTKGEAANEPSWSVRVPVVFSLYDKKSALKSTSDNYAKWEAYVPGPRTAVPWIDASERADNFNPDAMLAGELYTGNALRLLTPPGG